MCNLSCISVSPRALPLLPRERSDRQHAVPQFLLPLLPGLERGVQFKTEGGGCPCPSAVLSDPLASVTKLPLLGLFQGLDRSQAEEEKK